MKKETIIKRFNSYRELYNQINDMCKDLTDMQGRILCLRYGLLDGECKSMGQIMKEMKYFGYIKQDIGTKPADFIKKILESEKKAMNNIAKKYND